MIYKYFTHVDMPRKMQLKKTPVGLRYYSAAILWNFRDFICRSESATFFSFQTSNLEEYVHILGNS